MNSVSLLRKILLNLSMKMSLVPPQDIPRQIKKLRKQMKEAADRYEFERAAALRDQIFDLQERELELR